VRAACILAAGLLLTGSTAAVPPPGSDGWQPLAFRRIERHTRYTPVIADGQPAFRAESECAASALAIAVEESTLERTPVLRWRWKVERGLDIADERIRAGDDFAARVYLLFRFEPEKASWFERSRRALGERIYGRELPGNALNYVWSSRVARGEAWQNPYSERARMLSMGPAREKGWREERVDVASDYRAQFGSEPPALLGLAIMTDTDNTCGRATALFGGFRFEAPVTAGEKAP
jgi:hypothetical protein